VMNEPFSVHLLGGIITTMGILGLLYWAYFSE